MAIPASGARDAHRLKMCVLMNGITRRGCRQIPHRTHQRRAETPPASTKFSVNDLPSKPDRNRAEKIRPDCGPPQKPCALQKPCTHPTCKLLADQPGNLRPTFYCKLQMQAKAKLLTHPCQRTGPGSSPGPSLAKLYSTRSFTTGYQKTIRPTVTTKGRGMTDSPLSLRSFSQHIARDHQQKPAS